MHLLDRIDITYGVLSRHIEVSRVPFQKLSDERRGEPSAAIRARVEGARARQTARFKEGDRRGDRPVAPTMTNADMGPTQVRDLCVVDEAGRQLLGAVMREMNLSARAYHRVLTCASGTGAGKLARTIADLAGAEAIQPAHIAEAIHLRSAAATRVETWSVGLE